MNMTAESKNDAISALGKPVRRVEDERLLTGQGHYADDMAVPNLT